MAMNEYKCFTSEGCWTFTASNDIDAMRQALYYCWRDGEGFHYVERVGKGYTLSITFMDKNHSLKTINFHEL